MSAVRYPIDRYIRIQSYGVSVSVHTTNNNTNEYSVHTYISVECLGSCARRAVHIWIQAHMLAVVAILVAALSHACVVSIDSNITCTATQLAGLRLIPKQKG